ncbi:unnamed protein product [Paramecium primaurelia]|uniref:tRNA/rRNA methyltransferase SpoU type domain-containing protein n=1 Tax=Paramecium primaurelia TaxID=5886 RepID=A0A8S1KHR0_PARPR|nr:unnamed protein product [Paramecium primaurelia]
MFVKELLQIQEYVEQKKSSGKQVSLKPLIDICVHKYQKEEVQEALNQALTNELKSEWISQQNIDILILCYKRLRCDVSMEIIEKTFEISIDNLQTTKRILSICTEEQLRNLCSKYISTQGYVNKIVKPIYESLMNVNDQTMIIVDKVKKLYKNLFSLLKVQKQWVLERAMEFVLFSEDIYTEKSQKFVAQQFQEIRSIIYAFIINDDEIRLNFINYLPQIFQQHNPKNEDFKLHCSELIKIALFSKSVQQLMTYEQFWQSLHDSYQVYSDLTNNKICVAILNEVLLHIDDEKIQQHFKLFTDLFITLDSFGTHLTKDVWVKMDPFTQKQQFKIDNELKRQLFQSIKPLFILINKAAQHSNEKTIKNCIKSLFKKQIDVNYLKPLIIEIIIPVLNKPVFYLDTPLEGDSKFYELLKQFLVKIPYIDDIIIQMVQHIQYPLAVGAFSVSLKDIKVEITQFQLLIQFIEQNLMRLNLRKRIQLLQAVLNLYKQNTSPEQLFQLFKVIPFDCLFLNNIGELLKSLINEDFLLYAQQQQQKLDINSNYHQFAVIYHLTQDHKLFMTFYEPIISQLQQIYTSTYTQKETKHKILEQLTYLLKTSNQVQFLELISSGLFAYLTLDLEGAMIVTEELWISSLQHFEMVPQLTQQMSKFVGFLFQQQFDNFNIIHLELLIKTLKATNISLQQAKRNKTGLFVEELFLKFGLQLLKKLQTIEQDRQLKNLTLHFLSHILTLFREVNHKPQEYHAQVQNLINNIIDITDQFNAYDSITLYQLLRSVYGPEIAFNKEQSEQFKKVAINSFQQMMYIFGTHTNLDEILAYIDFIIDPCYFEGELYEAVEEVIRVIMKQHQKQWVIQRKIANNLVICLHKYPNRLPTFYYILFKLIKGSELRGYDSSEILQSSEQYVPLANNVKHLISCKGEFYGAYPRFLIFNFLFELGKQGGYEKELLYYIKFLIEVSIKDKYKNAYMQYTKQFRMKLHVWQNICCLKYLLKPENYQKVFGDDQKYLIELEKLIWKAFDTLNNPQYRQYIELMMSFLINNYPDIWAPRLLQTFSDPKLKVNIQIPTTFISCIFLLHNQQTKFSQKFFDKLFPLVSSNVAYIRSLCQTTCLQYIKKQKLEYKDFIEYFESNRECQKIIKNISALIERYEKLMLSFDLDGILTIQFDTFGEIIHPSIIEILKNTCTQSIAELKSEDNMSENPPPPWFQYVERQQLSTQYSQQLNFQRKINLIMDQFDLFKAYQPRQIVGDIIVVATLLEKIPNFGHLTRTCEIFGCRELVLPNKKILQDEQYQAVSVSAEQHLPILEIKEEHLMNYLQLKRLQGYQLVALEQTSQSKSIVNFKFDKKTVLVLGKEKTGLPIEYIELMDNCVEIPQYGVIRSLNVHISAVICVWQYIQQWC